MRLANSDLSRVLLSVNQLNSDHTPETLPDRTFAAARCLLSADVVSYEGFGTDNYYEGPLWYAPVENVTGDMLAAIGEYASDHPCFDGVAARHMKQSVRVSDHMTLPEFKRTTIYNEFFRYLGTDRQLLAGLHISRELTVTCSLCRLQKDYTERDCQIFDLLTPHLTMAFRQARFIHQLKFESEEMQKALEFTKLSVATVNRKLQILTTSPNTVKLLFKYFNENYSFLPEELSRYIKYHWSIFASKDFYLPPAPFEKITAEGKLVVRLILISNSQTMMLMLEEIASPSIGSYEALGLTNREIEVLTRISHGKTDGEIAQILKISVRTVQKHVENIFNKLGVETRTAASAKVL